MHTETLSHAPVEDMPPVEVARVPLPEGVQLDYESAIPATEAAPEQATFSKEDLELSASAKTEMRRIRDAKERELYVTPASTMGRAAVAAVIGETGRSLGIGGTKGEVKDELDSVRSKIARLSDTERAWFDDALEPATFPEWLKSAGGFDAAEASGKNGSLTDAIIEKGADGEYKMSDETLTNVLEYHQSRMAAEQQALKEELPELQARMKVSLQVAEQAGRIPEGTHDKLKRLEKVHIIVDDGTDTAINGEGAHVDLFDGVPTRMQIARDMRTDQMIFDHEGWHVLGGKENSAKELLGRVGNEAIAQYEAYELNGTHFPMVESKPSKESDGTEWIYGSELQVLWALSTQGQKPIDMRLFAAASLEDKTTRLRLGGVSAYSQLRNALSEAFPEFDVTKAIHDADNSVEEAEKSHKAATKAAGAETDLDESERRELSDKALGELCVELIKHGKAALPSELPPPPPIESLTRRQRLVRKFKHAWDSNNPA